MMHWFRSRFRAILKYRSAPASYRAWGGAALAFILLLACWGEIANRYHNQLLTEKRAQLEANMEHDGSALIAAINRRVVVLQSMAAVILSHDDEHDMIEETGLALTWLNQNVTGIDYISLAPDGVQRYIFPAAGNESLQGVNLLSKQPPDIQTAVSRAIEVRQAALGDLIQTGSGDGRIVAYYPVYRDNQLWGLVTLGLHLPTIFNEAALDDSNNMPQVEEVLRNDWGRTLYGDDAVFARNPVIYHLTGLQNDWVLAAAPRTSWDALIEEAWWPFLTAGLLVVSLLTVLTFVVLNQQERLVWVVRQRTEELRHAQDNLELRVKHRTAELTIANEELSSEIAVRERVAHQLHESEELYRTLITASPDAVTVTGRDGRITFASAKALQVFGYDYPEEMVGQLLLRGVIPAERPRAREKTRRLLDGQQLMDSDQFTLRRKDGRYFIGEVDSASLYAADGQPYGVVSITRDITRRMEMQDALARSEARFRSLIENAPVGITLARHGLTLYANSAYLKLFGFEHDTELVGASLLNQIAPEHRAGVLDNVRRREKRRGRTRRV